MKTPPSTAPRRKILLWGGAGAATGLAAYLGWPQDTPETSVSVPAPAKKRVEPAKPADLKPVSASFIDRDTFARHLNSQFNLKDADGTRADCKLVEVSPAVLMKTPKGDFTCFTALFEAHPDFLKDGGICQVSHAELKPMEIFLSPVGKPGKTARLEAAFTLRA